MATTANPPEGARPTNGAGDPFTTNATTPTKPSHVPMRYASFDDSQFSTNSPSHARRALEAHLKDTDRRIQDASRLGTTLLQQRKDLAARLKDVELVQQNDREEVPAELRSKLADLEREYNDIGRESARAFLPRARSNIGATGDETSRDASILSSNSRESPSKVSAPSRRQRNQPNNRVHDIEFATEISTSLLAQVRQLQAALAEKDEALREINASKAQLEAEAQGMVQRIRHMDESEQRYKDENWNLETRLQDLEASHRDVTHKHERLTQTLVAAHTEKSAARRELEELRASHDKLHEEWTTGKKQQESELHGLRRDATNHSTQRSALEKKIEELTAQNTELAKAVSYRFNHQPQQSDRNVATPDQEFEIEESTPEMSDTYSPMKGTPRHGMLESETLKSSLNHAHRMIQNLKNNIHREKTEKVELKRMLQDARDELETKRRESGGMANVAKKRRSESNEKFRKPLRPDRLGANRSSTTEILEDEDWEAHDGQTTPSKSRTGAIAAGSAVAGAVAGAAFDHEAFAGGETSTEGTDAFETANERDSTTEAFQTGAESLAGDSSDELTETENTGGVHRSGTIVGRAVSPLVVGSSTKKDNRRSYMSTASTSASEGEENEVDSVETPVRDQAPKYRLRLNRNGRRSGRASDLYHESPVSNHSPSVSITSSNGTPLPAGQSLGDELDDMDDDSVSATPETQRHGSVEPEGIEPGTPTRGESVEDVEPIVAMSPVASSRSQRAASLDSDHMVAAQNDAVVSVHDEVKQRPLMVDSGMMTEPWEPEAKQSLPKHAAEVVGGALAGFGLGRVTRTPASEGEQEKGIEVTAGGEEGRDVPNDEIPGAFSSETPVQSVEKAEQAEQVDAPATQESSDRVEPVEGPQVADHTAVPAVAEPAGNEAPANGIDEAEEASVSATPEPVRSGTPVQGLESTDTADVVPATPEPKVLGSAVSSPLSASKAVEEAGRPAMAAVDPGLTFSTITTLETEPVTPKRPESARHYSGLGKIIHAASKPEVPIEEAAPTAASAAKEEEQYSFSPIIAQYLEPSSPPQAEVGRPGSLLHRSSSRRMDALYAAGDEESADKSLASEARESAPEQAIPGTDYAVPGAGFLGMQSENVAPDAGSLSSQPSTMPKPVLARTRSKSMPASAARKPDVMPDGTMPSLIEPKVFGGGQGDGGVPTLVFGEEEPTPLHEAPPSFDPADSIVSTRMPLGSIAPNVVQNDYAPPQGKAAEPEPLKKPMSDEGSQTTVSGEQIERMLSKTPIATSFTEPGLSAPPSPTRSAASSPRRSAERPASSRGKGALAVQPPLPPDHTQKIAAAGGKIPPVAAPPAPTSPTRGSMGPPMMPASAYKQKEARPKTPVEQQQRGTVRATSRDGTTPRPPRVQRDTLSPSGGVARQPSVSSFASELDERFNIHQQGQVAYPDDVTPATDPRMIQAITQTMIGEYLWKYTRRTGRSEISNTRHRRFFWVHPYTRTLYWSETAPNEGASQGTMKAKSVNIESVRVITDDNAFPPGLHRKSLVVVTSEREIVFTAPTGQRHETWFNALSYLLLRTEAEKQRQNASQSAHTEEGYTEDDINEFHPGFGTSVKRSISRMTGRSNSRLSLSSYNSRTTRTSSPQRATNTKNTQPANSLAQRQSTAAATASERSRANEAYPGLTLANRAPSRTSNPTSTDDAEPSETPTRPPLKSRENSTAGGRFSSFFGRTGGSSFRGSFSSRRARSSMSNRSGRTPGDGEAIYDASVVGESAEDLRQVIESQERAERERDLEGTGLGVENVRSCCDGKHDISSLARTGRHGSYFGRGRHSHTPAPAATGAAPGHAHPRA
ncbi:hypothetical protein MBLNU230_g7958t1 [Neophaeotheca triangularis]